MMQIEEPKYTFVMKMNMYKDGRYIGFVTEGEYRGISVRGATIDETLNELSIAIKAIEEFKKYNNYENR